MLEAVFPTYAANAWRSIEVMPEYALNFMGADGIAYAINGYGGSGGNGYETRIRLFNNEHMFENARRFRRIPGIKSMWICQDGIGETI